MLDRGIVSIVQSVYDWVFDRTGLYKGQILQLYIFLYFGLRSIFNSYGLIWYGIMCLLGVGVGSFWNHIQKKRLYTINNIVAERVAHQMLPSLVRILIVTLSFMPRSTSYIWTFLFGIFSSLIVYIACVKIRDREPPEKTIVSFNLT